MKNCDVCKRSPNLCICPRRERVVLEHCKLCLDENSRYFLEWIGMPNPFGADRGEVFSHWECKDKKACGERVAKLVAAL